MKGKKTHLWPAVLLVIVIGVFIYLFGGPYRFVDRPLYPESLEHLRAGASGAPWKLSPSETAFEYFYWWPDTDRPDRAKLEITTLWNSPDGAVVTIIARDCQCDSTSRTCDRLTLRRESGGWVPVRHQAAWQGRGRIGWTTQPAL
jgi:hypothetical protein